MAVRAENLCFENMDFGPLTMRGSQDWTVGSALGTEDGLAPAASSSSSSFSLYGSLPVEFLQLWSSELVKQRLEMDCFLQQESQRMRSILQEETRQQAVLLQKYELRIQSLVLQKDTELTISRNKASELQNALKRAEMEAQAWKKKAAENEATVCDLGNTLDRVRKMNCGFPNAAKQDEAMSFYDSSSAKTGEKRAGEHSKRMDCKLCQDRRPCVVFFPCRHLCCCKSCGALSGQCPVCGTAKETCLEVLLA